MISVRVFADKGIDVFKTYIQGLKVNPQTTRPELNVEPFSEEFKPRIEIDETRRFVSRMELAAYLCQLFTNANITRSMIIENHGLWTWIAYLFFDQLAPVINETRKINEMARYVCSTDYRDYYRHYIAVSYYIFSLYGSQYSNLFLSSPLYKHGDFIEQLASRQDLISNPNLIGLSHTLYWDRGNSKNKRGATDRNKPGSLRRLLKIIDQFELTYDIFSMAPGEISTLLPDEFESWRT